MNITGIGNSAASWAQFVKLTQAARDRNSGLGVETSPAPAPQNINAVSFKRVMDVYSSSGAIQNAQASTPVQNVSLNRKILGVQFDAYA